MAPKSLADIATDGFFLSIAHDMCWKQLEESLGGFSGMETNVQSEDSVQLRFYGANNTVDVTGKRIAQLINGYWHWNTARSEKPHFSETEIPELYGSPRATEMLHAAARTVEGGHPLVLSERDNAVKDVIALDLETTVYAKDSFALPRPGDIPCEKVLIEGISDPFIAEVDEVRAVVAFAHARGLGIYEIDHGLRLIGATSGDIIVEFLDGEISNVFVSIPARESDASDDNWRLEDVSADSYYAAAEHSMFFSARYPEAVGKNVLLNLEAGRVLLDEKSGAEADALILATVRDNTFTWAWADPQLASLPAQSAMIAVQKFGIDKLIPAFVRRSMPAETARELGLVQAAMPIVNKWTVVTAKLNESTTGIVLIDAPELQLPPLRPEVKQAVLDTAVPAHIDHTRAVEAYLAMRNLPRSAHSKSTADEVH